MSGSPLLFLREIVRTGKGCTVGTMDIDPAQRVVTLQSFLDILLALVFIQRLMPTRFAEHFVYARFTPSPVARTVEQQRFARCRADGCHGDTGITVSVPHPVEKLVAGAQYKKSHQATRRAVNGKHPPAGRHGWRGYDRAPVAWP